MVGRLAEKVVVITGAAQGIGRGCAELMAKEGACVVIGDIQVEAGLAAVEKIREAGGIAIFQRSDVVDEKECSDLIESAVQTFGKLDALVNNVGWYPRATLGETTTELWDTVQNINVRSAFYCCKYAVPYLRKAGGGSIVNIGSIHGIQGQPNLIAYAAAKGGLLALTRTLAGAFANDRIRVNYILPGWVLTEGELALQFSHGVSDVELQLAGSALLLGRHQTSHDTAYAAIYLVSDEATQVTGSVISVDGGASTLAHPSQGPV